MDPLKEGKAGRNKKTLHEDNKNLKVMKVSKYRIALESVLKCETAAAKSPLARVRTEVFHFLLSQPSQKVV